MKPLSEYLKLLQFPDTIILIKLTSTKVFLLPLEISFCATYNNKQEIKLFAGENHFRSLNTTEGQQCLGAVSPVSVSAR